MDRTENEEVVRSQPPSPQTGALGQLRAASPGDEVGPSVRAQPACPLAWLSEQAWETLNASCLKWAAQLGEASDLEAQGLDPSPLAKEALAVLPAASGWAYALGTWQRQAEASRGERPAQSAAPSLLERLAADALFGAFAAWASREGLATATIESYTAFLRNAFLADKRSFALAVRGEQAPGGSPQPQQAMVKKFAAFLAARAPGLGLGEPSHRLLEDVRRARDGRPAQTPQRRQRSSKQAAASPASAESGPQMRDDALPAVAAAALPASDQLGGDAGSSTHAAERREPTEEAATPAASQSRESAPGMDGPSRRPRARRVRPFTAEQLHLAAAVGPWLQQAMRMADADARDATALRDGAPPMPGKRQAALMQVPITTKAPHGHSKHVDAVIAFSLMDCLLEAFEQWLVEQRSLEAGSRKQYVNHARKVYREEYEGNPYAPRLLATKPEDATSVAEPGEHCVTKTARRWLATFLQERGGDTLIKCLLDLLDGPIRLRRGARLCRRASSSGAAESPGSRKRKALAQAAPSSSGSGARPAAAEGAVPGGKRRRLSREQLLEEFGAWLRKVKTRTRAKGKLRPSVVDDYVYRVGRCLAKNRRGKVLRPRFVQSQTDFREKVALTRFHGFWLSRRCRR